jgi:hypothetical protein
MPGLLGANPLYGALYEPQPTGILSQPQPQGLLGAATVNPLMARQIAAQRAANPRPDVTDFMGYGPTWQTYLQNMNQNLQAQMMQPGDSGDVMVQKALGMLGNFGGFGITAYHGSPHRFDKFDKSKIGTGEGAQAYGHGLYFSESPRVAQNYQAMGAQISVKPAENGLLDVMAGPRGGQMESVGKFTADEAHKKMSELREKYGSLYKVDLPDEKIAKMLDWDRPLSQQPEVMKQFKAFHEMNGGQGYFASPDNYVALGVGESAGMKGADFYRWMRGISKNDADTSAALNQLGIPGIRYLDGDSRTRGKGTSNFVVFDDQIPKIIGRE